MENQPPDPGRAGGLPEGFRLVRELPRDGANAVYLAEDLARGGQVTLTALGSFGDPSNLARLTRDMDAVSGLRHPNILPVRAVADREGRAYLIAPFVEDPDLGQRLTSWGPLPPPAALQILGQLADALDAAHRAGVVHGWVRPRAVRFAGGSGQPYLAGFGASVGRATDATVTDLSDLEHLAPEQVSSTPVGPRTDVYALGGLLFQCLTGVPPFRGFGPGAVLAEIQRVTPPRVSAYRPELPAELDRVVATAMAKDPAHRYSSCRALIEAVAAAVGTGAPQPAQIVPPGAPARRSRRLAWRIVLAVLVVLALAGGGVVVTPYVVAALRPTAEDLARVPEPLRGDCDLNGADARLPAAQRVLRCAGGGQEVLIGLFGDQPAADAAYRGIVTSNPAVRSGVGDCGRTTGWEHRYPGVGVAQGRVVCDRVGAAARLAWADLANRSVSIAERADGNSTELYNTWSGWVRLPAFPTPEERQLQDLLPETSCQRSPAGLLDGLDGVVAGVECEPNGSGASTVNYFRFTDQESMQRAYDAAVAQARAASGVNCLDPNASTAGEDVYPLRTVDAGRLLCSPDESEGQAVTWTTDAMLILARGTGPDRAALVRWWNQYSGPRVQAALDAINQQSTPPFPTAEERELLRQIPSASQVGCVRPGPETVRNHVGNVSVVAVACGTTANGPGNTFYYRFADAAALNAAVDAPNGADCQTLPPGSLPAGAVGSAPYVRPDGSTGILTCGMTTGGNGALFWTDDQTLILGVGITADPEPALLIPWWQTEAGPL